MLDPSLLPGRFQAWLGDGGLSAFLPCPKDEPRCAHIESGGTLRFLKPC